MGSLPSFAIQMAVVLRTIHLAERQYLDSSPGIERGILDDALPGCVHFGVWCEPQPRLCECCACAFGQGLDGVGRARRFSAIVHNDNARRSSQLLWSAYRCTGIIARNQVVAVFDEWGLGYADGMPSSSHKAHPKSALQKSNTKTGCRMAGLGLEPRPRIAAQTANFRKGVDNCKAAE